MKKILILSIVFCLTILTWTSCQQNPWVLEEQHLEADLILEQLSDGKYLTDIRSVHFDKNLYLADYETDQVHIIDTSGVHLQSIGRTGRGPGELMTVLQSYTYSDTLYVFSGMTGSYDLFKDGRHIKTTKPTSLRGSSAGKRFFVRNGRIYASAPGEAGSLLSFSHNNPEDIKLFGVLEEFHSELQTEIRNHRHVFPYQNQVISVSNNLNTIEIYSADGRLEDIFDYSGLDILQERVEHAETMPKNEFSYMTFIGDACLFDDHLYLLLLTKEDGDYFSNTVLKIDLGGAEIKVEKAYRLGPGRFSTIAADASSIWAFQAGGYSSYLARFPKTGSGQ